LRDVTLVSLVANNETISAGKRGRVPWWKVGRTDSEFRCYAIAASISWVVLDSVGVVVCFIDSALK
jgi:hypothetical protein